MLEFKCPKCGSEDFDCFDIDFDMSAGIHWDICSCNECEELFKIKYSVVAIEDY